MGGYRIVVWFTLFAALLNREFWMFALDAELKLVTVGVWIDDCAET